MFNDVATLFFFCTAFQIHGTPSPKDTAKTNQAVLSFHLSALNAPLMRWLKDTVEFFFFFPLATLQYKNLLAVLDTHKMNVNLNSLDLH